MNTSLGSCHILGLWVASCLIGSTIDHSWFSMLCAIQTLYSLCPFIIQPSISSLSQSRMPFASPSPPAWFLFPASCCRLILYLLLFNVCFSHPCCQLLFLLILSFQFTRTLPNPIIVVSLCLFVRSSPYASWSWPGTCKTSALASQRIRDSKPSLIIWH